MEKIVESITTSRQNLIHPIVLQYIIKICGRQIQHLSFPIYYDAYLTAFHKLGNLLILDLENSSAGDCSLKSIGIYCSHLRYLAL